ncbi:MAG: AAA family ATPase [Micrococcales bacterium]|nr:AAA family ATPase [Micrococcales bacterium]
MTMIDTLFGLVPVSSTGQQWVARDLQLVNWGGYDGHHTVRFAPTATLLYGASGSGKSTLMDAYIALLMPHTTPFNGASNGGVVGRPRGKDQRNVVSYARGKIDESRTADGTQVVVLRGDGRDTWTAIAMTWADQAGAHLTALRAWYVPAAARTLEDVTTVRATVDGAFSLRDLEPAAAQRLTRASLGGTGLTLFDTDRDFTARLHLTLGIGAAGGGAKAVSLLGRIQAGQQITTVDRLYKDMVLEEPDTFATADAVVEQFDKLSGTRDQMITAQQQVRLLVPVRAHRASVAAADERLAVIATVGTFDDAVSPAARWRQMRRLGLLRSVEDDLRRRHQAAQQVEAETAARIKATKAELDAARQTLWTAGGDRLANAQRELDAVTDRRASVGADRARLDGLCADLAVEVTSEEDFRRLTAQARETLTSDDAKRTLLEGFADAKAEHRAAADETTQLTAERETAGSRRSSVPADLHTARCALADAAGLTPDELPFVAELVEVRTEHEPWREAFNLALGGFATLLLVDVTRLGAFRKAIDAVPLHRRIRFEGVRTDLQSDVEPDPRTLPGRLDVRPGVFSGWLRSELARRFAYVCVDTPGELSQHPKALTRTGQTAESTRGAHGGRGRTNVLGFSNAPLLRRLNGQLDDARRRLAAAEQGLRDAETRLETFDAQRRLWQDVAALTWDQVDVAAVEAEQARWERTVAQVTDGQPDVVDLSTRVEDLETKVSDLTQQLGLAREQVRQLSEHWSATTDEVDQTQTRLDTTASDTEVAEPDADQSGPAGSGAARTALDDAQRTYLDSLVDLDGTDTTDADPQRALAAFDTVVARAQSLVKADRDAAQREAATAREALRRTFETFTERWPDPNLGTDPDTSYHDFDRILTDLETSGLHQLEAEWRKSLLRLSGNDLSDLYNALTRSVREIKDRIRPVNDILAGLPFADDDHRLRIDARDTQSAVVARFRAELRTLREVLATDAGDDERERRYLRTRKIVDRIRRTAPEFADLVDVRRHVRLSAEKTDRDGNHVALYDHIGEKSGGESQELVAFIVGAALRYQLGDAAATRPRYAPVFLDEALIKADPQFTGRAVNAWRGLGFQLVIGAPNDKASALEPHVDVQYVVLKDPTGRSRAALVTAVPDGTSLS